MKRLLTITAIVALAVGAGFYALAQQPYQLTPMDEAKRERALAAGGGTYHVLPATLETTQWGWLARPRRWSARAGVPARLRPLLLPRLGQATDRLQARDHDRSPALPRHLRGRRRPQRARAQGRPAHQGRQGPDEHAAAVEERLQHGPERAAGKLDALHPGLSQGRAQLG